MSFNRFWKQTFCRYNFIIYNNCRKCSISSSQPIQSSLYVSAKYGQELFRVLDPTYDVNYLNYIEQNLDKIEQSFRIRNIDNDFFNNHKLSGLLNDFIKHLTATESLKKKRNKLIGKNQLRINQLIIVVVVLSDTHINMYLYILEWHYV